MTHRLRFPVTLLLSGLLCATTSLPLWAQASPPPARTADAVQEAFVRLAERVKPSVVNIVAERRVANASDGAKPNDKATPDRNRPNAPRDNAPRDNAPRDRATPDTRPRRTPPDEDEEEETPFGLPFPFGPRDPRERTSAMGTGMVVRADGYILTNYHIVKGATSLRVLFNADTEQPDRPVARLIGFDEESDLAILKIARTGLRPIEFADSDQVRIGEWAIAIGAPFEQAQTVTVGIVSAKGRHLPTRERLSLQDYIQTDASINPGNSGGPLLDLEGRVIGINTAILSPSRFNVGIGFSVPSNTVKAYLPTLMSGKSITRGFLGINYVRIDRDVAREFGVTDGVQIGAMATDANNKPMGPASAAGLQPGDIITAVNGIAIDSSDRFRRIVSSTAPGQSIRLAVVRPTGDRIQRMQVAVTLGDWAKQPDSPDSTMAPLPSRATRLGMEVADIKELAAVERDLFNLTDDARGAIVRDVEAGSAADDAQIGRGSILVRLRVADGAWQKINDKAGFLSIERSLPAGARVLLEMKSGRGILLYKVVVVPSPAPVTSPADARTNTG